jgi:hypothetical protein
MTNFFLNPKFRRLVTQPQSLDDEGALNDGKEGYAKLVESGEDSAETQGSSGQPLDLVAFAIHSTIVFPW